MKIVLLGAGNVATHIGIALKNAGVNPVQVYSRSVESANKLADLLNTEYCCNLKELNTEADIYLYAVKDDALQDLILQTKNYSGVHVHTAGSVDIDIFRGFVEHYGVLYPLQTFSINKPIDFNQIPLFIEAGSERAKTAVLKMANLLSSQIYENVTSEKRKQLHLSAVFACNFANYMYVAADKILNECGFDYKILLPLINETTNKLNYLTPKQAQTGPAVRKDKKTMLKHIALLQNNNDTRDMYKLISKNIERNID